MLIKTSWGRRTGPGHSSARYGRGPMADVKVLEEENLKRAVGVMAGTRPGLLASSAEVRSREVEA